MKRRMVAAVVAGVLALWLFSPAFAGYHLGSCTRSDYTSAQAHMAATQGQAMWMFPGQVQTLGRLFQWCKPDTNPADYPRP